MPVKKVELLSIDAKRFSKKWEKHGRIRIDNNSSITLVSELSKSEVNIDFRYTANYGNLGAIRIEGNMVYSGDSPKLRRQWEKSRGNLPPKVASEIHTAIMRTCIPEAVSISKDLRLPPPIPLPHVNLSGKGKKKFGPEVA